MSAEDWIDDSHWTDEDETYRAEYFSLPKPRKAPMHKYKILVVVTGEHGLTSQLLHYVSYDDAETAYDELTNSHSLAGLSVSYIRLYKIQERGWRRK
jgi:hypothetical protein